MQGHARASGVSIAAAPLSAGASAVGVTEAAVAAGEGPAGGQPSSARCVTAEAGCAPAAAATAAIPSARPAAAGPAGGSTPAGGRSMGPYVDEESGYMGRSLPAGHTCSGEDLSDWGASRASEYLRCLRQRRQRPPGFMQCSLPASPLALQGPGVRPPPTSLPCWKSRRQPSSLTLRASPSP